jgi:outer membrane protein OmpA-like peptidoglycan-associated protein
MRALNHFLLFACVAIVAMAPRAFAADASDLPDGIDLQGSTDHALIQRFEGAAIRFYEKKAFGELVVALGSALEGKPETRIVEGPRTTIAYVLPQDVSALEALRAYKAEVEQLGDIKVLFEGTNADGRRELDSGVNQFMMAIYGDIPGASRWMNWNPEYRYGAYQVKRDGGDLTLTIYAGMNAKVAGADGYTIPVGRVGVRIDIVEPKPMVSRMVTVKSEAMSAQIRKSGSVSLYGILFDTNKAELKAESAAAMIEIGRLMAGDSALKLLVVGHTDSVGAFEANRELSQRRAKAVVDVLIAQYGVSAERLSSFGASFAAPVASNADDAGRAQNRRVELVGY